MKPLLPNFEFCVLDLETTGLSPTNGSGIIEVAGVKIEDGEVTQRFEKLANPGHSIPEEITEITGLDDSHIIDAPRTDKVLEEFLDFIEESILVAHNARFDLSFLKEHSDDPVNHPYIDTLRMARQLLSLQKHSLTYLAGELDLPHSNPHRAGDDAMATTELFFELTEQITRPKDYFRCNLPERILEEAPFDVPRPEPGDYSEDPPEQPPTEEILFGLYELDTTLGINKLARILSGSNSQSVDKYVSLDSYGQLSNYTQEEIKSAIDQTLEEGYVERSGDQYPVLNLTDSGLEILR